MKKFTASEVRKNGDELFAHNATTTRAMLYAYADRLEADEKAVPVYQHRSKNGPILRWFDCSEETFMAMEHNEHDSKHFDRRVLYTHPSPADAERLADALIALDCEHDWQVEHKRAEKAEAELAALKSQPFRGRAQDAIDRFAGGEELSHEEMCEVVNQAVCAERELVALKAKIADAPAVVVQGAPGAVKASFNGYGCFEYAAENLQPKLRGKRVRLVVEE